MLAEAQARVVFSSALETAVGARSALRMAFAWRGRMSALGFGVWPLFSDTRFDGPATTPFLRADDVNRINPEDLWNAAN
jgi:O-succinylbenzoate synthase